MQILVLSFFLLGLVSGFSDQEHVCDGEVEGKKIADPNDCKRYFRCGEDGEAVHEQCFDSFFSLDADDCDFWMQKRDCGARPDPEPKPRLPKRVLGMYMLLADDTVPGFKTASRRATPSLHKYQQEGANVLFFTFVNPSTMVVPDSFRKLAATRGTDAPGAVPESTIIIFSIGGSGYSKIYNPWKWLTSKARAESVAKRVAMWPELYGCDGIEVNIENGAGNRPMAGKNLVHFLKKLRELKPDIIITQPSFGWPQVSALLASVSASWNRGGISNNLADSVGLMVYDGTEASDWVEHYSKGSTNSGSHLQVDVPTSQILLGVSGTASAEDINTLAQDVFDRDLLGLMVWHVTAKGGLDYLKPDDASKSLESRESFVQIMKEFQSDIESQEHLDDESDDYDDFWSE